MGCTRKSITDNFASSEVISFVLVFMMISGFVSTVMIWGVPYIDEVKDEVRVNMVFNQLEKMDHNIDEMVKQGVNCSQVFSIVTDKGFFSLDSDGLCLMVYYSVVENFDYNITFVGKRNFTFQHIRPKGVPASIQFNTTNLMNETSEMVKVTVNTPNPSVNVAYSNIVLTDAVIIDVVRPTLMSKRCEFLGRIFLFDLGSVKYILRCDEGYEIVFENCGIHRGSNSLLLNSPEIYFDDDRMVMRLVKFLPKDVVSSGSLSEFQCVNNIGIKVNRSYVIDSTMSTSRFIKMLFFGEYQNVWTTHFVSFYGFRCWKSSGFGRNDIYYLTGDRRLTILCSICSIDLTVRA